MDHGKLKAFYEKQGSLSLNTPPRVIDHVNLTPRKPGESDLQFLDSQAAESGLGFRPAADAGSVWRKR